MGILHEDVVVINQAEKAGEPTVITVNCLDKTGLGCDLCRVILLFGLSICRGDVSTDGKWCYIVFWVVGKPSTRWNLLTKRLLAACPSYFSTSGIFYYRPENQQPKPPDVFLLKFWCSYERDGLLHDVTEVLCELELTINSVKISTTPDGRVMDLFFITDTREILHTKRRQDETIDSLKAVLCNALLSCEIELAGSEVTACSQGSMYLPSAITEEMFSLELPNGRLSRSVASNPVSVTVDNHLSPSLTLVQIFCQDHKGLIYDIMRTLKDYNIQVRYGRFCATPRGNCELDLFIMQADGKKIVDRNKQNALCSRLRMELLRPLRVAVVSRGPDTELLVANPVELSGRGRPLVFYDITLALKVLKTRIFSVKIGRHMIRDREWEVYRILLDEGVGSPVPRNKIEEGSSWQSANQIPISTLCYLQNSKFTSAVSSAFRRTRGGRKPVASSKSSTPWIPAPEIRRPSDRFYSGNGLVSNSPNLNPGSTSQPEAASELGMLLELLPLRMRSELYRHEEIGELVEVVMDLGRSPIARFPSGDWVMSEKPVNHEDLRHAVSKVSEFSDDNRSGINNSLHRISAIRNRKMQIIGLTCRVGRAVSGSAEIIRDLVEGGGSILVIGPPGVGKTTLIREIARMLADDHMKRVVIVDTSNEIGGDGDVPHAGIGRARRMQVPNVNMQHNVMIEAVENHMPETIIIDEIGTELEALAASTIAQRGVQLVGTAHGMTIDNVMKNPSLQILVGGIESVTLGDEEARRRKVQKTILERRGPPTFTCAVEIISKTELRVHHRLDATVDAILAGKSPLFEIRHVDADASGSRKSISIPEKSYLQASDFTAKKNIDAADIESDNEDLDHSPTRSKKLSSKRSVKKRSLPVCVYAYKILEADLLQVAKVMGLEDEIEVTDDIGTADVIIASSYEMKQSPWIRSVTKFHDLPVFVMKSNTMAQMVKAVRMILEMESVGSLRKQLVNGSFDIEIEDDAPKRKPSLEEIDALEEVRLAIEYIVIPGGEPVELLARRTEIIARQLELVESYQLAAENSGTEMNPRLQILPMRLNKKKASKPVKSGSSFLEVINSKSPTGGGGGTSVARLPLISE
ncbi:hypothetical protein ACFX13_001097 [Malus domestica]